MTDDTNTPRVDAFVVLTTTYDADDLIAACDLFDEEERLVLAVAADAGENHRLPKTLELARSIAEVPGHPTAGAWAAYAESILDKRAQHTVNAAAVVVEAESLLEQE